MFLPNYIIFSYPLLNVPLPGNIPTVVTLPLEVTNLDPLAKVDCNSNKCLQGNNYVESKCQSQWLRSCTINKIMIYLFFQNHFHI